MQISVCCDNADTKQKKTLGSKMSYNSPVSTVSTVYQLVVKYIKETIYIDPN